ncbi:MAG: alpha/beta fold hydrolase, partial [Bacteroidota bacterium]
MKLNCLFLGLLLSFQVFGQNIPRKGNLGVKLTAAPENTYQAIFAIAEVSKNSTAESLGLQAQDVLIEINQVLLDDSKKIPEVIGKFVAGNKVRAKVLRQGQVLELNGTVKAPPPYKKPHHQLELLEIPFREGYVRGYLTRPEGEGPFPTIYYIQGYPCQSINSHPQHPTVQMTSALVDLGYAVFRIEKPGVGEFANLSPCMDYSFDDEVDNFKNGLTFLQNLKSVDTSEVYLFGHSLGGNVAPLLAQGSDVSGVITYGTLVKPWQDYLLDMAYYSQTQAQEASAVMEDMATLKSANQKLYVQHLPHTSLSEKEKTLLADWHDYRPDGTVFNRALSFWQNFNRHNYIAAWAQVKVPVLSLYGESDAHAISALDSELIALTVNQQQEGRGTFRLVKETNHLFAKVPSRAQELENINNGLATQVAFTQFNPALPLIIDNWIKQENEQASQRTFEHASRLFPKAETNMSSMDVVKADVNNDGQDDLILATEFGPNKLFLYDNGRWKNHPLPQLSTYSPPYKGEDSEDIAVADFNKDGNLDLFFVSEDTKNHELLFNNGQANYTFPDFQIPKKGQANAVLVHDFNQ